MRKLVAVVLGIVLANLLIFGSEWILPLLPFGGAVDPTLAGDARYVETLPFAAQGWIVFGWTLGPMIGGFAAFALGRSDWTGWIVAGVAGGIGTANALAVAHPAWMLLGAIAAPFVGVLVAFGLYRRWRAARLHLHR